MADLIVNPGKLLTVIALLAFMAALGSCAPSGDMQQKKEDSVQKRGIEEVLREHTPGIMAIEGVTGTAEGLCGDRPCIKVYVARKTPELTARIPSSIEGYPVEVEETGEFKAL
jgi:hypothetical protein